jgi:hypothetical protein
VGGFGIGGVELLCSAARELAPTIDKFLDAINLPIVW